jgi:hypothetical protein
MTWITGPLSRSAGLAGTPFAGVFVFAAGALAGTGVAGAAGARTGCDSAADAHSLLQ